MSPLESESAPEAPEAPGHTPFARVVPRGRTRSRSAGPECPEEIAFLDSGRSPRNARPGRASPPISVSVCRPALGPAARPDATTPSPSSASARPRPPSKHLPTDSRLLASARTALPRGTNRRRRRATPRPSVCAINSQQEARAEGGDSAARHPGGAPGRTRTRVPCGRD